MGEDQFTLATAIGQRGIMHRYRRNPLLRLRREDRWHPKNSEGARSKIRRASHKIAGDRPVDALNFARPCRYRRSLGLTEFPRIRFMSWALARQIHFSFSERVSEKGERAPPARSPRSTRPIHQTTSHRNPKNSTRGLSRRSVLSTSNNAATDPCARRSTTSLSVEVRLW